MGFILRAIHHLYLLSLITNNVSKAFKVCLNQSLNGSSLCNTDTMNFTDDDITIIVKKLSYLTNLHNGDMS